MFVGKAGAYPLKNLLVAPLLALPINNRLGWKGLGLTGTNTSFLQEFVNCSHKKYYNYMITNML
jgi:hypothetical protein